MKLIKPYIDENWQVIFIELDNQTRHDFVNGAILALMFWNSILWILWWAGNI